MNEKKLRTKFLGYIEVTGGVIRGTDPCYDRGTRCAGDIQAKNGKWRAKIVISDEGAWGERVALLQIRHEDHTDFTPREALETSFGVDSGQFGFFDGARFPDDPGDYREGTFYMKCCDLTYDSKSDKPRFGGVLDDHAGVVSSSGFGDGGYEVRIARDEEGKAIALDAIFISEESDEEEDEDAA